MSTTVATIDVGGTGANTAADARINLGVNTATLSNTTRVFANSASAQGNVSLNFVNTATVQVSVTPGSSGNANVSFTAADAGFNPFLLAGM